MSSHFLRSTRACRFSVSRWNPWVWSRHYNESFQRAVFSCCAFHWHLSLDVLLGVAIGTVVRAQEAKTELNTKFIIIFPVGVFTHRSMDSDQQFFSRKLCLLVLKKQTNNRMITKRINSRMIMISPHFQV